MTIREAYDAWVTTQPQSGIMIRKLNDKGKVIYESEFIMTCCKATHAITSANRPKWIPKPDKDVCEREVAWRNYVRLRDKNPDWPKFDPNSEYQ